MCYSKLRFDLFLDKYNNIKYYNELMGINNKNTNKRNINKNINKNINRNTNRNTNKESSLSE